MDLGFVCVLISWMAASYKLQLYRKQIYPSWLNVSRHQSCLHSRTYHASRPMGFGVKHLHLSPMSHIFLLLLRRRTILVHGSTLETYPTTFFRSDFGFRAFYLDGALVDTKKKEKSEPRPCAGNDGTTITVSLCSDGWGRLKLTFLYRLRTCSITRRRVFRPCETHRRNTHEYLMSSRNMLSITLLSHLCARRFKSYMLWEFCVFNWPGKK